MEWSGVGLIADPGAQHVEIGMPPHRELLGPMMTQFEIEGVGFTIV